MEGISLFKLGVEEGVAVLELGVHDVVDEDVHLGKGVGGLVYLLAKEEEPLGCLPA